MGKKRWADLSSCQKVAMVVLATLQVSLLTVGRKCGCCCAPCCAPRSTEADAGIAQT
jgi:hypothetical protein